MGQVGGILAIMGLISSAMSFADRELALLQWIDNWGTGTAWGIRIGMIVVGLAIIAYINMGSKKANQA